LAINYKPKAVDLEQTLLIVLFVIKSSRKWLNRIFIFCEQLLFSGNVWQLAIDPISRVLFVMYISFRFASNPTRFCRNV